MPDLSGDPVPAIGASMSSNSVHHMYGHVV